MLVRGELRLGLDSRFFLASSFSCFRRGTISLVYLLVVWRHVFRAMAGRASLDSRDRAQRLLETVIVQ